MKRLLLLLPTTGYRTRAFVEAAGRLDVALTVASGEASTLAGHNPGGLWKIDFANPNRAARQVARLAADCPIDAVVGVDDATSELQATIACRLGLPSNPVGAVSAARNKLEMRRLLHAHGITRPFFRVLGTDMDPAIVSSDIRYPCVLKPLNLSGSRGVIRANSPAEFAEAFRRLSAILRQSDAADELSDSRSKRFLAEDYVDGIEVSVEGLLMNGRLRVLALFDKPEPLTGPFFEETIYTTPTQLRTDTRSAVEAAVASAAAALGLITGPIHAEVRIPPGEKPVVIELNPRSIGGRCSRALRFAAGVSLEEIILRQALGLPIPSLKQEACTSGVIMIPCPGAGRLCDFGGVERALATPGVTEVEITAHRGQQLIPLPEGSAYPGFIFAQGRTQGAVVTSLREAHRRLWFQVEPPTLGALG
jgi:biotin carboxylase